MPVSDKTAIITGAGSRRGIGRATAHAMAARQLEHRHTRPGRGQCEGWTPANEVAERNGVKAVGIACDVTDEASVERALAALDGSAPPVGALGQQCRHHLAHQIPGGYRRGMGPDLRGERPRGL